MQQKRFHIIIDISHLSNEFLMNKKELKKILKTLPSVIHMNVLKGPFIAEGVVQNPGLSGLVIIDFSHISIHTFTEYSEALVDIFSCRPFSKKAAINFVLAHFRASSSHARMRTVFWG